MNLSLTLFLIILNHAFAEPGDSGIRYDSWMKNGKQHCAAQNDQVIKTIEEATQADYRLKYCLFENDVQQPQGKICEQEVNFLFHRLTGEEGGNCGPSSYQTKYTFSYYKCGDQRDLVKFQKKNSIKDPIVKKLSSNWTYYNYQICYDTVKKRVLWTMHDIKSPKAFLNLQNEIQPELPEPSTDPYFMNPNLFTTLETQYELEKEKNPSEPGTFIMVPQPLVPPDHFIVHLTKKATNHYINMAPLWEKLVPLIKVIDEGIKQAQLKLAADNPNSFDKLIILTKVFPSENVDTTSETWFNLLLFQGNIWYKLIFRENQDTAVMIIIHNTPGKPPAKGCLVGRPEKCQFEKWSKNKTINIDYTVYAYCCEVTVGEIEQIFSLNYENVKYFKIHDLITG